MIKARENFAKNKQDASDYQQELLNIELDRLDRKQEIADAEIAIAAGVGDVLFILAGKNKTLSLAALAVEKAAAITQIISNISIANAKAMAISPLTFGQPWVSINTGLGAISIARVIAESVKSAGEISRYATGGKIKGGVPINTGTVDNRLIAVNETETVLTARQVAMLGGSGAMRRIKVPGYADGGYVGQQSPEIPASGFDYNQLARLMNSIDVRLDINKVNSAQREVQVITETNRI
jgi:hypothetical protein